MVGDLIWQIVGCRTEITEQRQDLIYGQHRVGEGEFANKSDVVKPSKS